MLALSRYVNIPLSNPYANLWKSIQINVGASALLKLILLQALQYIHFMWDGKIFSNLKFVWNSFRPFVSQVQIVFLYQAFHKNSTLRFLFIKNL